MFNEIETNTIIYCKMANITCLSNMTALSQLAKKNNVTLKSYLIKDILHHVHTCDPICGMGG